MANRGRGQPRRPATKFAHLRKRMLRNRLAAHAAGKRKQ